MLGKGSSVKSVSDLGDLAGKQVLIRCDLNVPLDGQTITDDGRIRASLPTINQLRDRRAKISCSPIWAVRRVRSIRSILGPGRETAV